MFKLKNKFTNIKNKDVNIENTYNLNLYKY